VAQRGLSDGGYASSSSRSREKKIGSTPVEPER